MKEYKRVWNVYSAWDYTREIEDLNKMSDNGWQLIKGGLFSNRYKKNDSLRYRYQLDYNPKIEDMGRYIETFREQGWEYVNSTFNGWHYFRKYYDQAGDDYEIYSDSESLKEMQAKWQKMGTAFTVTLALLAVLELIFSIRYFRFHSALLTLTLIIEAFVIGRGVFVLRNPQRADGHKRSWNGMPVFLSVLLIGVIGSIVLMGLHGNNSFKTKSEDYPPISASIANAVDWGEIKVLYPDFYNFEVSGYTGSPMTFSVVNAQSGEVVSQIRIDSSKAKAGKKFKEDHNILLKRGTYKLYGSDFAGGSYDLHVSLN